MECLFCKIAQGTIPTTIVAENSEILAFHDIKPQAPIHLLVIPRQHISSIDNTDSENELLLGRMILTAKNLAKTMQINEKGYRLVFNVNAGGGQEVYHIHLHLLGGRQMHWPPG